MLILAIDTSTDQASIALADESRVRAEWSWSAAGNHSSRLTRLVKDMLDLEDVHMSDIEAVAVASGPGSFSGVRVGVSFAKGLGMALSVPVSGIGTLDILGLQGSYLSNDVVAALPAGREQLYVARFAGGPIDFRRDGDYRVKSKSDAVCLLTSSTLLCGPGAPDLAQAAAPLQVPVEPHVWSLRRAGFLAELGRRHFAGGGADQAATLEPLYIRRSSAEEKRQPGQE